MRIVGRSGPLIFGAAAVVPGSEKAPPPTCEISMDPASDTALVEWDAGGPKPGEGPEVDLTHLRMSASNEVLAIQIAVVDHEALLGPGMTNATLSATFDLEGVHHSVVAYRTSEGWRFEHVVERSRPARRETTPIEGFVDQLSSTVTALIPLDQIPGAGSGTELEVLTAFATECVEDPDRGRYLVWVGFKVHTGIAEQRTII